jgi:hypothetical protein
MRFVAVRELRSRPRDVWRSLGEEGEVVLTSNGKPIGILASTSEALFEETLKVFRRARAMAAVASMQRKAVRKGLDKWSLAKVNRLIRKTRKEKEG